MGAPWAPAYACLHLGWWEESDVYCLSMYLRHVHRWLRYTDDVLVIWGGTMEVLHQLISEFNINERKIRLIYTF